MLNVALTGNTAAGKTTVGACFARWGATLIDADELVRHVQAPGSPVLAAIAEEFGAGMIRNDGTLDRARLRRRVMANQDALTALNSIVHPAVQQMRAQRTEEAAVRGSRSRPVRLGGAGRRTCQRASAAVGDAASAAAT
jgi:dephospho-CoA kinase